VGLRDYILRRSVECIITFFIVVTINFFLFRIMPGDPTIVLLLNPKIKPETRLLLKHQLGLDLPYHIQYFVFIKNLLCGEFGISFHYGRPVIEVIGGRRLFNTLMLLGSSTVMAIIIGTILGAVAAWRRGAKIDISSLIFSLLTYSMPVFWLGMMLILIFSVYLRWFPIAGTLTAGVTHPNILAYIGDYLWHMTLPALALTLIQIGSNFLIMRNSLLDVFTEDYIVTARAKGLKERDVLVRHAMRNAMLPMITIIALQLATIVNGATLTETVFSWAGLGRLTYEAVLERDYPVLQGILCITSIAVLLANFIADIIYGIADPRVRYGGER